MPAQQDLRRDWRLDEVLALFDRPLNDLLFEAQSVHRRCHPANEVQVSTLLSIKTGGCPEDCRYCPQSVHTTPNPDFDTDMEMLDGLGLARQAAPRRPQRRWAGSAEGARP